LEVEEHQQFVFEYIPFAWEEHNLQVNYMLDKLELQQHRMVEHKQLHNQLQEQRIHESIHHDGVYDDGVSTSFPFFSM